MSCAFCVYRIHQGQQIVAKDGELEMCAWRSTGRIMRCGIQCVYTHTRLTAVFLGLPG